MARVGKFLGYRVLCAVCVPAAVIWLAATAGTGGAFVVFGGLFAVLAGVMTFGTGSAIATLGGGLLGAMVLRLAWLIAQLNQDLPMYSEQVAPLRLHAVAELALRVAIGEVELEAGGLPVHGRDCAPAGKARRGRGAPSSRFQADLRGVRRRVVVVEQLEQRAVLRAI